MLLGYLQWQRTLPVTHRRPQKHGTDGSHAARVRTSASVEKDEPQRIVFEAEAIAWLRENPAVSGTSVVTSMPDVSETHHADLSEWKNWFVDAARIILEWIPVDGFAIFHQSDIRYESHWVDKGYLVMRAAEAVEMPLIWHKIACRKPPGTLGEGRPTYAHILCFGRGKFSLAEPGADVLPDAGDQSFSRATGAIAAQVACAYLRFNTETKRIVDPFCGEGTILAAANAVGLDALGVDLNPSRVAKARKCMIP